MILVRSIIMSVLCICMGSYAVTCYSPTSKDAVSSPVILKWIKSPGDTAPYIVQISSSWAAPGGANFSSTVWERDSLYPTTDTVTDTAHIIYVGNAMYYWHVTDKHKFVSGWDWSQTDSFRTTSAPYLLYPAADTVFTLAGKDSMPIVLKWAPVNNASGFSVRVSVGSAQGWSTSDPVDTFPVEVKAGSYTWQVMTNGNWSLLDSFSVIATPGVPALVSPSNGTIKAATPLVLTWSTATNAATYAVQVSNGSGFGSTVTAQSGLTSTSVSITNLANATTYFWRANAKNPNGVSGWSAAWSFTTTVGTGIRARARAPAKIRIQSLSKDLLGRTVPRNYVGVVINNDVMHVQLNSER